MRLGHHFQGQKVEGQGHQAALLTAGLRHQAAAAVNVGRNVLTVGTYCYVAGPKITEKKILAIEAPKARRREALRRPQRKERGGAYCGGSAQLVRDGNRTEFELSGLGSCRFVEVVK